MKQKLITIAGAVVAMLAMGITMPACPGQQAMQQQIDDLKARDAALSKQIAILENSVRTGMGDIGPIKQAVGPMGQQLQAMGPRLDALDAAVKDLQAKVAASAAAPKGGKKRR